MTIKQGRPVQPRGTFQGARMRRARISLDIGALELGNRVGVAIRGKPLSMHTIYGWETGRARPNEECVVELERVLKCKLRSA